MDDKDAVKSLRPDAVLPTPGHMPDGSFMKTIQDHRKLRAGVDENTRGFSERDPLTGKIDGFEVDIVRAISRAIFGDDREVQLKTVTTDEKVSFVEHGDVDLTVSAVSMTCDRLGSVDFSTEYYLARHRLLVSKDSDIESKDDLAGRKVCVTKRSSSEKLLRSAAPRAIKVALEARTDCLMALQLGEVDAYLSHDAILRGMEHQDRTMKIVGQSLQDQRYGIAVPKDHPEFVRFVNAVLERRLPDLYRKWFGEHAPRIPRPEYRDAS